MTVSPARAVELMNAEMVQRAQQAIAQTLGFEEGTGSAAVAVLETLREPTDAMIASAMAPYRHGNTEQFDEAMRTTIAGYWRAMIDAALK